MRSFLSSPIATSVSNIASVNIHKHSSFKTKKDYSDFITWLDASNNDIRKIKLPSKKKLKDLEDLDFSSMLGGGNPLAALLGEILGGLATSLGIPSINNLPTFGKTTRTLSSTPASSGKMGGGIGGIPPISKINVKDITNKTKLLPSKPNLLPETKIKGLLPSSESRAQTKLLPEKPKISQPGKGFASLHPDIAGQGDFGKRADKILEERRAARLAKDGTKAATKNITNEAEKKAAKFAGKNAFTRFFKAAAPGAGSVFSAMDAKDRADKGDKIGSWISGTSSALSGFAAVAQIPAAVGLAIPGIGWAETAATELVAGSAEILSLGLDAVNLVRDLTGNSDGKKKEEKPKNKIDVRLKAQEKTQREAASASNVTFVSITDKFDKVVSKFEKIAGGMGAAPGKQPGKASNDRYEPSDQPLAPNDPTEPPPPPLPPGSFAKAPDEVLTDASSFRQAFPLAKGTPKLSTEPYELQMRENDSLGSLGNDPQVDPVHAKGSAHYENRAIDIPVNNMDLGDKVANWWRGKGYKVLWRVEGHYNHVHVQWAKGQKKDKKRTQGMADIRGSAPDTKQQSIEDFAKQTMGKERADRILKDPKLKEQLSGGKQGSDPGIKQLQENYNVYVKGIRERRQAQIAPGQIPQVPEAITTPLQEQTPGSAILLGQPSVAPAGQSSIVPVHIPMGGGGGGGGVAVVSIPEGQILNSLWKIMLLTNLSSA